MHKGRTSCCRGGLGPRGQALGGRFLPGRRREDGEADQPRAGRSASLGPSLGCALVLARVREGTFALAFVQRSPSVPPRSAGGGPRPGIPLYRAMLPQPADSSRDSPFPKVLLASSVMVSKCLCNVQRPTLPLRGSPPLQAPGTAMLPHAPPARMQFGEVRSGGADGK